MNSNDPLAQLRDIHLPEAVSAWPPALGWWILLALVLLGLVIGSVLLWRRHLQRRYLREAKWQLQALTIESLTPSEKLQRTNDILKRCAIIAYPQQPVAHLSGRQWLEFLNTYHSEPLFADTEFWLQHWYRADIDPKVSLDFIHLAERWLNQQPRRVKHV